MNTAVSNGLRQVISVLKKSTVSGAAIKLRAAPPAAAIQRWIGSDCRVSISIERGRWLSRGRIGDTVRVRRRNFHATSHMREEKPASATPNTTIPKPPTSRDEASSTATPRTLPSTTDNRRSEISKRLTRLTDTVLARASIAGQHINEYTGTDYSGIETIRSEIAAQEESMRSKHGLVSCTSITMRKSLSVPGTPADPLVCRWIPHVPRTRKLTPGKVLRKRRSLACSSGNHHGRPQIWRGT
jgi:hypothetical protein